MKVLLINNHHKIIGGAEKYYFDLGKLLEQHGHEVAYFSTIDKDNVKTKWSRYFIKKLNFKTKSLANSLDKFPKIFYSVEAKCNIAKLLDDFRPDIVHLQNIYYYITPSIIKEIKRRGIPIVQTVHDYQLISPSVIMYHNGSICEICKKNKYYKAIFHKCVKNSYMATLMAVVTLYFQNFRKSYVKRIDTFISPSMFTKKKLEEYGIPKNKIVHINNFVPEQKIQKYGHSKEKYVLYFGRICEAKGIFRLLNAAGQLPDVNFKIAGNFEDDQIKKEVLIKVRGEKIINVEFVGFKKGASLQKLISQSEFTIVPSEWYENQPYAILESFALGKPVIASKIGGIPELVKANNNGLIFNLEIEDDLTQKIKKMWGSSKLLFKMGNRAKTFVESKNSPIGHYKSILKIYNGLIK